MSTTTPGSQFVAGVKAELPILLGVVPFGLIYGILALDAGLSAVQAQAMSLIVFAGSAQFVMAQLFALGTPATVIVVTAVLVNLRHALYSASVAPYVNHLSGRWRFGLAYLLTDEAYAVAINHYQRDQSLGNRRYFEAEIVDAVQIALASLPELRSQAIRMRYLEGRSVDEIAREMNKTVDAVESLIYFGRCDLKERLGKLDRLLSQAS